MYSFLKLRHERIEGKRNFWICLKETKHVLKQAIIKIKYKLKLGTKSLLTFMTSAERILKNVDRLTNSN